MKNDDLISRQNKFFFVVGYPGSGKTHLVHDIINHLDIDTIHELCPCISDMIRNFFIFGRFKTYHGESKTNIGDGTDRMFCGVDTARCMNFIKLLQHDNNILLCEGITSVLCNVGILNQIKYLGYNLQLIELNTPLEECINNLKIRDDYNDKTKKLIEIWTKKRDELSVHFSISSNTQYEAKNIILNEVSQKIRLTIHKALLIRLHDNSRSKYLLNEIKKIIYTIKLRSQQTKNTTKKWVFQFQIGRTVTRFNNSYESCQSNIWNNNTQVNMCDVENRKIPKWKKNFITLRTN